MVPDDDADLDACLVDGAHDSGVDFLCKYEDKFSSFRQASCVRKVEDRTKWTGFSKCSGAHPRLGADFKKSQALKEALTEIDWAEDHFELRFITLVKVGRNTARARSGPSAYPATPELKDLPDRCELVFADEQDLNEEWRESESTEKGLESQ